MMINYVFHFGEVIGRMREEGNKEVLERYEAAYGSLENIEFEETQFYKDYLSKFPLSGVKFPKECFNQLFLLVAGSLTSDYAFFSKSNHQADVLVKINNKGKGYVVCSFESMWDFQIDQLYKIYITEQMEMCLRVEEDIRKFLEKKKETKIKEYAEKYELFKARVEIDKKINKIINSFELF